MFQFMVTTTFIDQLKSVQRYRDLPNSDYILFLLLPTLTMDPAYKLKEGQSGCNVVQMRTIVQIFQNEIILYNSSCVVNKEPKRKEKIFVSQPTTLYNRRFTSLRRAHKNSSNSISFFIYFYLSRKNRRS